MVFKYRKTMRYWNLKDEIIGIVFLVIGLWRSLARAYLLKIFSAMKIAMGMI